MKTIYAIIIGLCLTLTGCGTLSGPGASSRGEASNLKSIRYGVIKEIRSTQVAATPSTTTKVVGAVAGATLGFFVGDGAGRVLTAAIGGFGGSKLAEVADRNFRKQSAVELLIQTERSDYVLITQEGLNSDFMVGARVEITTQGSVSRVRML